jgi:hypothetical protein
MGQTEEVTVNGTFSDGTQANLKNFASVVSSDPSPLLVASGGQ